ncbi:MAG: hypothetical protein QOH10_688 [Actinomycetota bacterium]|nr:hypothetical protein [Actinomycetota bacterium]
MWSLDRRVAASAVVGAALALAIPIAVADGPAPAPPAGGAGDPVVVVRELVALANRGARATWMVTFAFTRTTANGGRLHNTIVVAHRSASAGSSNGVPIDIDDGFGSLVVTAGVRTYSCTVVNDEPQCLARAAGGATARPGAVYGGAVVGGRYDIARMPAATIAGLDARCFSLRLRAGLPLPGLGFSSEQCYSLVGVPLRSRVQRSGAVDERVALTVRRRVGRDDLLALLSPYGLQRLVPGR